MTSIFGPIVTEADIRAATISTIRTWATTYTMEIARQKGFVLPPIRTYGAGAGPTYPADELPACVVVAPGLASTPEVLGDGSINAPWSLGIGIVVAAAQRDDAIALAGAYIAALRALILQNPSLGGLATECAWLDEEVTQIGWELDRVIAAGTLQFRVIVPAVVNRRAGMAAPPPDPTSPTITSPVSTTGITIARTP